MSLFSPLILSVVRHASGLLLFYIYIYKLINRTIANSCDRNLFLFLISLYSWMMNFDISLIILRQSIPSGWNTCWGWAQLTLSTPSDSVLFIFYKTQFGFIDAKSISGNDTDIIFLYFFFFSRPMGCQSQTSVGPQSLTLFTTRSLFLFLYNLIIFIFFCITLKSTDSRFTNVTLVTIVTSTNDKVTSFREVIISITVFHRKWSRDLCRLKKLSSS